MNLDIWEKSTALLILGEVWEALGMKEPYFQGPDSWFADTLEVYYYLWCLKNNKPYQSSAPSLTKEE